MKTNHYRKYDTLATHWRGDLDGFCGFTLLTNFGEDIFPTVNNPKFEFLKKVPERAIPGTIYVDIGEDRLGEFDEHRSNGGRLQNTCSTTLVARRLGICNKPGVNELSGEVLWCDTKPKVFPTQLSTLTKAMHRVKAGKDQFGTYLWANAALKAIIFSKTVDDSYDIRQAWKNFREDKNVPEISDLETFIEAANMRRNTFVTELAAICALMRPDTRQKWLLDTFRMLVKDNQLFQDAVAHVNNKGIVIEVETDQGSEPMLLIESDNEHIASAASSKKTGRSTITVIRNSVGHTAILCDQKRVDLVGFAEMVRMAEYRKLTGKKLSSKDAQGLGIVPKCRQWCLANNNLLLNGSLTHPLVMDSKLTLEEHGEIGNNAFMKTKREAWFLNYYKGPLKIEVPKNESMGLVLS